MCLNPRVGRVVHEEQEAGHHARVELLLEDGRKVGRHLANGVAAGVPNPTQTSETTIQLLSSNSNNMMVRFHEPCNGTVRS